MKMILLTASLLFCALSISQAADLFTPPSPKTNPNAEFTEYKTSAEFLKATRSGEVPKKIQNLRGDYRDLGRLVSDILQNDYNYPNRYPHKFSDQASSGSQLLEAVTRYELAEGEKRKAEIEREFGVMHKRLYDFQEDPKFINALDLFLKDYTRSLREHIAAKKKRDEQQLAAETERQRQADSKAASTRAEEETRSAAVAEAMSAQARVREQKLHEVLNSTAYKLWQASLQIEEGLRMVAKGQGVLDHEDAVQRESGVVDLSARRTAGERIVAGKSLVEQAFATYKQLKGTARTPDEVRAGPDPAQEYR